MKKHGEAALLAVVETVVERLGGGGAGSSAAANAPPMDGAKASTAAMATAESAVFMERISSIVRFQARQRQILTRRRSHDKGCERGPFFLIR